MTKKITGSKKHRGIKDPVKLDKKRNEKVKNKINNPPADANAQQGSKRFEVAASNIVRKRRVRNKDTLMDTAKFVDKNIGFYPNNGKAFKPIPTVKQNLKESRYKFLERVKDASKMVLNESKFQDKYKLDVTRDERGEVVGMKKWTDKETKERMDKKRVKRKERDLKRKMKKKKNIPVRKEQGQYFRPSDLEDNEEEDKTEGDKEYITNDEDEEEEDIDEREKKLFKRETFAFGETVHHPPKLETEKLDKKIKENKRMKIRNFLFLEKLDAKEETPSSEVKQDTSQARKEMLEREREKAVFAYRQIKARQREKSNK